MKVLPSSSSLKYKPKEFHNTTGGNDLFTETKAPISQRLIYEKSGFHPREKKRPECLEISAVPSKLGTLPAAAPMFAWRVGQLLLDGMSKSMYFQRPLGSLLPCLNTLDSVYKRTLKMKQFSIVQLACICKSYRGTKGTCLVDSSSCICWCFEHICSFQQHLCKGLLLSYHLHVDNQEPNICLQHYSQDRTGWNLRTP